MFINVLEYFFDNSTIAVLDDRIQTVRRRSGEKFLPQCLKKTVKFPDLAWFVGQDHGLWEIPVHGTSRLQVVEGTMNQVKYVQVLEGRLLRQVREWFSENDSIFQ